MMFFQRAVPLAAFFVAITTTAFALPNPTDLIPAQGGPIKITPIFHGSLQIEYRGKVIHVDPFSAGDYSGAKKADFVFITHSHPDHFDAMAIERLHKANTHVFVPASMASQAKKLAYHPLILLRNGQTFDFRTGPNSNNQKTLFLLEAVPMYNLVRGPKPGQRFHPKGQFNGYVLTLGGKRLYIAGDTEATPEMKALKNIDIAFLPMNLPYTMTPQEAAQGAKAFRPKVVYPYHYRFPFNKPNNNPQEFQKALIGTGIQVRFRGWYAHPAKG